MPAPDEELLVLVEPPELVELLPDVDPPYPPVLSSDVDPPESDPPDVSEGWPPPLELAQPPPIPRRRAPNAAAIIAKRGVMEPRRVWVRASAKSPSPRRRTTRKRSPGGRRASPAPRAYPLESAQLARRRTEEGLCNLHKARPPLHKDMPKADAKTPGA
jgi:hypothetical protein